MITRTPRTPERADLDLAIELAQMHSLLTGRVTSDDVVASLVEQLAAAVVGLAYCRHRPLEEGRAHVVAMLEASIASMAADTVVADALAAAEAGARGPATPLPRA